MTIDDLSNVPPETEPLKRLARARAIQQKLASLAYEAACARWPEFERIASDAMQEEIEALRACEPQA